MLVLLRHSYHLGDSLLQYTHLLHTRADLVSLATILTNTRLSLFTFTIISASACTIKFDSVFIFHFFCGLIRSCCGSRSSHSDTASQHLRRFGCTRFLFRSRMVPNALELREYCTHQKTLDGCFTCLHSKRNAWHWTHQGHLHLVVWVHSIRMV